MTADIASLVSDNLDIWAGAIERKASARQGNGKRINLYGVERLRGLILDLAVRGKLLPQDASDEPAADLLPKIEEERRSRVKAGDKVSAAPTVATHEPFELPATWLWLGVGQTGNIFSGTSVNASIRAQLADNREGVPFVATKDVGYGRDPIEYNNGLLALRDNRAFKFAKPASVFICAEGGSAGKKIAISDREIAFGNKLIANETWSAVDARFALYVYLSGYFYRCFSDRMTGIIGGIPLSKFLRLPFPLPPFAEQQRIVAKVDELMALCDALEQESAASMAAHQALAETLLATLIDSTDADDLATSWKRLEVHFDTLFTTEASVEALRQVLLGLAVFGKLSSPKSGDDSASEAVREATRAKKILSQEEGLRARAVVITGKLECSEEAFPVHWELTNFDTIFAIVSGVTKGQKVPADEAVEVPYLRVANVQRGYLDLDEVKSIEVRISDRVRYQLRHGDVLMTEGGDWDKLGRAAIWHEEIADCIHQNHVFRLRFNQTAILPEWVEIFVNSPLGREYFGRAAKQTTNLASINMTQLRSCPFPVPPSAEQWRIVAKIDELMAACDALKSRLNDADITRKRLADAIVERAVA